MASIHMKLGLKFKSSLFVVGVFAMFAVGATAQPSLKRPALPANLSRFVDKYPADLLKVTAVKARLRSLLGRRFSDFNLSIDVQGPMTRVGDFLLASGCLPHACTINEAAFAIDMVNKRVHAVIYEKDKPAAYFNEERKSTPQVLLNWVKELEGN